MCLNKNNLHWPHHLFTVFEKDPLEMNPPLKIVPDKCTIVSGVIQFCLYFTDSQLQSPQGAWINTEKSQQLNDPL